MRGCDFRRAGVALGIGVLMCALGGGVRALGATGPDLLSMDEIHKLVDAGQYQDALRAIARILPLNGPAVATYDRYDLLMSKAECLAQVRDNAGALAAVAAAKKEALAENKPDQGLLADAFGELVQKSPGGMYTPKTGPNKTPIKMLDRSLRKSAYDALFADQFAFFQQKAATAATAKTLPPFMDAAKAAAGARAAEFASTGSNQQTAAAIKDLADRALKLVNSALEDLSASEMRISTSANRLITETYFVSGGRGVGGQYAQQRTHKNGLTGNDAANLKAIIDTCGKMPAATTELADAFGTADDGFKAAARKAEDIKAKATVTLTTDYSGFTY